MPAAEMTGGTTSAAGGTESESCAANACSSHVCLPLWLAPQPPLEAAPVGCCQGFLASSGHHLHPCSLLNVQRLLGLGPLHGMDGGLCRHPLTTPNNSPPHFKPSGSGCALLELLCCTGGARLQQHTGKRSSSNRVQTWFRSAPAPVCWCCYAGGTCDNQLLYGYTLVPCWQGTAPVVAPTTPPPTAPLFAAPTHHRPEAQARHSRAGVYVHLGALRKVCSAPPPLQEAQLSHTGPLAFENR